MSEPRFKPGDRVYHIGAKLVPAGEYEIDRYCGNFFRDSLGESGNYYRLVGITDCIVSEVNLCYLEEYVDQDACAAPDLSALFGGEK